MLRTLSPAGSRATLDPDIQYNRKGCDDVVDTGRFAGKVALITGAAQGLGARIACRLAAEGAAVAVADTNGERLRELAAAIGPAAHASVADVRSAEQVTDWVDATGALLGGVDVLVCAAGIIRDATVERMSDEDFGAVLDVSLRGTFHAARAVTPAMKRRGSGRIVTFASICWRGNYGQTNYAAAKAGVVGLTRSLALELGPHGITANVVSPGLIDTPMLASMKGTVRDRMVAAIPARRVGDPDDIAAAVAFLASDEASYVNGAVLDVDGGLSVGIPTR